MTKTDRNALGDYVRDLANRMGLRDWTIRILDDPPTNTDACAQVRCIEGRKIAQVRIADDWNDYTDEQRRHAVVHELCHAHFASVDEMIRRDVIHLIGQSAYDVLWNSYVRQMEYGVDAIAEVIAPFMPEYPSRQGRRRSASTTPRLSRHRTAKRNR